MENLLMEAHGIGAELQLFDNKIRITRHGLSALSLQGSKGNKDILIKQISSIQFKKPGVLTNGYIQFAFLGGQEAKGGILQAAQDENTVMFKSNKLSEFEEIKQAIEKKIENKENTTSQPGYLQELEKLSSLREKGIITEEEFNAKKKQLLGL